MSTSVVQKPQLRDDASGARPALFEPRYVRFGAIQIDLQRAVVTKDGLRIRLTGKAYEMLLALLERPGEILTREWLYERVWPLELLIDKHSNLNTTINKLRASLGDSLGSPLYIETIPRKGYTFIGRPEFSDRPNGEFTPDATRTLSSDRGQSTVSVAKRPTKRAFPSIGYIALLLGTGCLLGAAIWMAAWFSYLHHGIR